MKFKKTVILLAALASITMMSACGNKDDTGEMVEPSLNEFVVDDAVVPYVKNRHITDYNTKSTDEKSDTTKTNTNSDSNKDSNQNQNAEGYGMAELEIVGEDNSQYYTVDGDDILYGDVRYKGLHKAVLKCAQPYGENTFLNFIVKTYLPEAKDITVMYYNEEEPETVKNLSQAISDDLRNNWDGYSFMKTKYGTDVTWMMFIYETETGDRQARIYGCKDYLVYAGSSGVLEVNMSAYKNTAPVGAKKN